MKFGKYIPELQQESREVKLKKFLTNKFFESFKGVT